MTQTTLKLTGTVVLNQNEQKVFDAMVYSSDGNGHDFGYLEDVCVTGLSRQAIGAYITDLQAKGLVHVHGRIQFTLTDEGFRLAGLLDYVGN